MTQQTFKPWNPPGTTVGQTSNPGEFSGVDVVTQAQANAWKEVVDPLIQQLLPGFITAVAVDPGPSAQPYDNQPDSMGRSLWKGSVTDPTTGEAINTPIGRELQKIFKNGVGSPVTISLKPQHPDKPFPFHFDYEYPTSMPPAAPITEVEVTPALAAVLAAI